VLKYGVGVNQACGRTPKPLWLRHRPFFVANVAVVHLSVRVNSVGTSRQLSGLLPSVLSLTEAQSVHSKCKRLKAGLKKRRQCDNYILKWYRRCNNIVSYDFIWIRRTCDYILLNAHYCVLFSSRLGSGLGLGLDLVCVDKLLYTRICATLGCNWQAA